MEIPKQPRTEVDARTIDCPLKADNRAPLLMTTSTQLNECREFEMIET